MSSSDTTLGTVVDVVDDGSLLVDAPERDDPPGDPLLGHDVVDRRHEPVGKIVDVVGPVTSPYFLIEPDESHGGTRVVGKEVYAP